MIVSHVIGGLGNQMFQYATGRALSLHLDTKFLLDISDFPRYEAHQGFELQRVFECPVGVASEQDILGILSWQGTQLARRLLRKNAFSLVRSERFVVEPTFEYTNRLEHIYGDAYLFGYWQSELYFARHSAAIRGDFYFKAALSSRNAATVELIKRVNSVSVHIRRGDYVSSRKAFSTHGVCSVEFYKEAFAWISQRTQDPVFFVFSDDMDWVRANLFVAHPCYYIDYNQGVESYNDMRLMSLCKHHIIANSSFSWWGAWLNPNPKKIVIAPRKWFATEKNVADLLPGEWIKL